MINTTASKNIRVSAHLEDCSACVPVLPLPLHHKAAAVQTVLIISDSFFLVYTNMKLNIFFYQVICFHIMHYVYLSMSICKVIPYLFEHLQKCHSMHFP